VIDPDMEEQRYILRLLNPPPLYERAVDEVPVRSPAEALSRAPDPPQEKATGPRPPRGTARRAPPGSTSAPSVPAVKPSKAPDRDGATVLLG
jgi:hypothetical protein